VLDDVLVTTLTQPDANPAALLAGLIGRVGGKRGTLLVEGVQPGGVSGLGRQALELSDILPTPALCAAPSAHTNLVAII
jgi:hypothetical protein